MAVSTATCRKRLAGHHAVGLAHHEGNAGCALLGEVQWCGLYKDGFFYSRYPEPAKGTELSAANEWQKVYYHKAGRRTGEGRAGV